MSGREVQGQAGPGRTTAIESDAAAVPGKRTLVESLGDARSGERGVPFLVDGEPWSPHQLRKTAFLDELQGEVVAVASDELAPESARSCPYIDQYFAKYRLAPATEVLAVIDRFAPAARGASSAHGLIAPLVERITDTQDRQVYIYTRRFASGTPSYVTIHELMHSYTSVDHYTSTAGLGEHFVEGASDYFTHMICRRNALPFKPAYPSELRAVEALAAEVGDEELAHLTFHGVKDSTKQIIDSKGPGTWDAYRKKMKSKLFPEAAAIIRGAAAADRARIDQESAAHAKEEADSRKKLERDLARDRETWKPEGRRAVKGRVLLRTIHGDQTHLTISRGGEDGVREAWIARVTLKDGRAIEAKIVHLTRRTAEIAIDTKNDQTVVEPIEIRPP